MGYYSNVLLVFSNLGKKELYNAIRKELIEDQKEIRSFLRCADKIKTKNGSILFYWNRYKWDDGYFFVPFLYSLLRYINKKEFLFVRYGELLTDIEILGSYCDNKDFYMEFSRNIFVDNEQYY